MSPEATPAWARAAREAQGVWPGLADLAGRARRDGLTRALICGVGGSSLTARVVAECFGTPAVQVLDTTAPRAVLDAARAADAAPTLYVIASKSGTTAETDAHRRFFEARARPDQFVAITDPGSPLDALARSRGYRAVIRTPPDVGGRYSAFTGIGLLPAALAGVDGAELARRAQAVDAAAARELGARLAADAAAGRDKLALEPPAEIAALASWIEQLVAESSGKAGRGVIPLVDDPHAAARTDTRVITEFSADPLDLGVEFARWAHVTTALCERLGVNPYDQPDVDEAKALARDIIARWTESGTPQPPRTAAPGELGAAARPGDYLALLLYLPAPAEGVAAVRAAWARATGLATTVGYGPAYLHSTGQLHKGGPNTGLFLVVTADDDADAAIPGLPFTFGQLQRAQALGDVTALLQRGRRVAHVHLARAADLTQLVP